MIVGYAVGVFDLFHYGHKNLINESLKRCQKLIIGVHTDDFVESYKRRPQDNQHVRKEKVLDFMRSKQADNDYQYEICLIDDNHLKLIEQYNITVIFHGTDWELESYKKQIKYYEFNMEQRGISVQLINYSQGISTTDIINGNLKNYRDKRCFLFDLDNTLMLNNLPTKFSVELLNKLKAKEKAIYLVTNNNRYSPLDIYQEMKQHDLEIPSDHIITSLVKVRDYLLENRYHHIYFWGSQAARGYLESHQIKCCPDAEGKYDLVVVLYHNNFNYQELSDLCQVIRDTDYLLGNIDPLYPDREKILPDTGSVAKLLEASCGKKPIRVFGKPDPDTVSSIMEKYSPEEILFIGDSDLTDKLLALNCGIDFLRVHPEGDISHLGVLCNYLG